nr:hypothetical protein [Terrimonas sp. H1YJ31]
MKYLISFLLLFGVALASFGQEIIKLDDVSKHVGDSVKVCGKVYGIRYLEQAKNSPTFINVGVLIQINY